jgi:hemoglobin
MKEKKLMHWRTTILEAAMALLVATGFAAEQHQTLYERLGGRPAIQAVVDDFVGRVVADDRVNKWFAHAAADPAEAARYKLKLGDFICQTTGGPCHYTGTDLGTAHRGRGITSEAFDAVVDDLTATLEKLGAPEREKVQLLGMLAPMKSMVVQQ